MSELNPADGTKLGKVKIKESDVREVVKGLWEGADLEGSRQFFYPMFRAEIVQSGRARYVWLDGITGKELEL